MRRWAPTINLKDKLGPVHQTVPDRQTQVGLGRLMHDRRPIHLLK